MVIGAMWAQNPIGKYDLYVLHKFRHFLLGSKFVFLCRPYGSGVLGQQTTGAKKDNKMVIVNFGI
jgi:hypothetical protein